MNRFRIKPTVLSALTTLSVLSVLTPGSALSAQSIERADVERVITTLAADDMMGRATFSPQIDRAADFIANEFADIGLQPLPGLDGYRQEFVAYSITPQLVEVSLNRRQIDGANVVVSVSAENIRWRDPGSIEVITVGPQDDLQRAFGAARRAEGNVLVLVDPSHRQFFSRIGSFLSRPSRTLEMNGRAMVLVLTDETRVSQLDVRVQSTVEQLPLANVTGMIPGRRPDEIVLFSGHYDHIGIRPGGSDSIANGANDDASGTTAVIEMARYFNQMPPPERTLMFVAFTAEEIGGYGSRYFSRQLDPDRIVAMFNIEMIGKPGKDGPNTAWITGFERSSFGEILQRATEGTVYEFYPDPYPSQNLFYRSDNATLARLGVPAHSISTTPIDVDRDYHQVSDEVSTLDLDHMTNTIRAIAAGATTIISGHETPTRVDTSQVN